MLAAASTRPAQSRPAVIWPSGSAASAVCFSSPASSRRSAAIAPSRRACSAVAGRGKLPDRGDRALDHGRSEVVERRGHYLRAGGAPVARPAPRSTLARIRAGRAAPRLTAPQARSTSPHGPARTASTSLADSTPALPQPPPPRALSPSARRPRQRTTPGLRSPGAASPAIRGSRPAQPAALPLIGRCVKSGLPSRLRWVPRWEKSGPAAAGISVRARPGGGR